ncbi:MAG: hypothetical protein R3B09_17890 [Nannocystaceae bacterium]
MELSDKKLYCEVIAQLLIIDGAVTDEERAFLDAVFDRLGLTAQDRRDVVHHVNVDDKVEDKVRRLSPAIRDELTRELAGAAGLDHDVSPAERDLIARVREVMAADA